MFSIAVIKKKKQYALQTPLCKAWVNELQYDCSYLLRSSSLAVSSWLSEGNVLSGAFILSFFALV